MQGLDRVGIDPRSNPGSKGGRRERPASDPTLRTGCAASPPSRDPAKDLKLENQQGQQGQRTTFDQVREIVVMGLLRKERIGAGGEGTLPLLDRDGLPAAVARPVAQGVAPVAVEERAPDLDATFEAVPHPPEDAAGLEFSELAGTQTHARRNPRKSPRSCRTFASITNQR